MSEYNDRPGTGAPEGGAARDSINGFVLAVASVSALGGVLFGFDTGIISGALLFIEEDLGLSDFSQQAVVSSLLLAAAIGALGGGPVSDIAGRRKALLGTAVLFCIGAIMAAAAQGVVSLVAARVVLGLAVGAASMVVPVYIAEMAPARFRGMLVSLQQFMITAGILLSYLTNYAFSGSGNWRLMLGAALLPGAALFVGMLLLPESPRWLLARGRRSKALSVLARARHEGADVEAEAREIERSRREEARTTYRDLLTPAIRPALLVAVGIAFFNQMVGINAVIYYAPTILSQAGFGNSAAILSTAGVGGVFTLVTAVSLFLIDRVGRRPLFIWGTAGIVFSHFVLGVAFLLPEGAAVTNYLLVGGLIAFISFFAPSLAIALWLFNAELFPVEVRGKGSAAGSLTHWIMNFVVASTVLTLINTITPTGAFWFYGFFALLGFVFVWRLVPETKGKNLEQISLDLARRTGADQAEAHRARERQAD